MDDLISKYKEKLEAELGEKLRRGGGTQAPPLPGMNQSGGASTSREYEQFRSERLPAQFGMYEKACGIAGNLFNISVSPEKKAEFEEYIKISHLNVKPGSVMSLAVLALALNILLGMIVGILGGFFFLFTFMITGIMLFFMLLRVPKILASSWRMRASNQMVLCIFYVVTYMRHTSNIERAIEFASQHLTPPLSLDLKKVLWDVESGAYSTMRDSLEAYLITWKEFNMEFVEAFHLIESSLYEPSEERRQQLLDKSLDVILEETYEKMLHYAHNLKSPITTLHMLGIMLPILGLVILPLAVSFSESIKWYHLLVFYNIILPGLVYYLGKNILSTRPSGYGDTDISDLNSDLKKLKYYSIKIGTKEILIHPAWLCGTIFVILLLVALSPIIIQMTSPGADCNITKNFKLFDFEAKNVTIKDGAKTITQTVYNGPYGVAASILSLFFPISLGLSLGLYYKMRSSNVIKIRDNAKRLEEEFAASLFQLGNRLGDGLPAEIAFGRVAEVTKGTQSGAFFETVNKNIIRIGLSLSDALFHPTYGAIKLFPSNIVVSSMKVLTESIKKGPKIASQALLNVSRYIKEIHRVDERLKDLMADIISDMKSQIHFLAPTISGIVVGITSMITLILRSLSQRTSQLAAQGSSSGFAVKLPTMLGGGGIPTYYFQLIVGIYIVQILYILTILSNGIENGVDELGEKHALGSNILKSTMIYVTLTLIVMLSFNAIAVTIMSSTISTAPASTITYCFG